jgi:chemotaxis protein MotA
MRSYSSLIGYILVGGFIYWAIMKATSSPELFFNAHGIGIVGGGLLVTGFASFPFSVLWSTVKSVFRNLHVKSKIDSDTAEEVFRIASAFRKGLTSVESELETIQNSRVREATNLLLEGINKDSVVEILDKRIDELRAKIHLEANVCMTLGKYSPALGLAATTLGLVDLLSKLSNADLGALGYGMAVALSGTFYGILLANVIFIPLSELITSGGEIEAKEDQMIRDGFECLLAGRDPIIVGEVMNSYLGSADRINFSKVKGASESSSARPRQASA